MPKKIYSIISGTGSFIPSKTVSNEQFLDNVFYGPTGKRISESSKEIVDKFKEDTTICQRPYVSDENVTSDIAFYAAKDAILSSDIDKESFDYIIVAHNFGDISANGRKSDFVPSIASRVKNKLGISNPNTVCYDIIFGCPGWLQGLIQADCYIKAGFAKRVLVIGAETLSRVSDPHDKDSMLYADGAGAAIVELFKSDDEIGILAHYARSDTINHSRLINMEISSNPNYQGNDLFLKMNGHNVYEYALFTVPLVIKHCLEIAGIPISNVHRIILHQANGKMNDGIIDHLYKLYGTREFPITIMPKTISWLGNSSGATLPTLLDLMFKGKFYRHRISKGDILVFASVGAGMNTNSLVYKIHNI